MTTPRDVYKTWLNDTTDHTLRNIIDGFCVHCQRPRWDHAEDKCLFEPTMFKQMSFAAREVCRELLINQMDNRSQHLRDQYERELPP